MIRHLAFSLLGAAALTPMANAQVSPPLEDVVIQGEILNRSVGEATGAPRGEGDPEDNAIDGEAGIYVLVVNDIFFMAGSAGLGHTTNPTRTATDAGEDQYADFSASMGVATRIAESVDFSASLNVDGRDFFDSDTASSRGLSATAAVGAPLFGPVYGSLVGFAGYAFDDRFSNGTAFYGLSGNLSTPWKVSDQLLIRPGVGLTQQWSDVSENNSLSATASVDAVYAFTPDWVLAGRVSISRREYDDFFEDVTFVEREDTTLGVSASLVWRPTRNVAVSAGLAYED